MIVSLFRKDPAVAAGEALYTAAVEQARLPRFYADFGVPDTVEGRFEMIAVHAFLILTRLKGDGPGEKKVGQKLFDAMFQNLDDALRELGVGDLSVGKKIRKLAENFFGRVGAYGEALRPDAEPGLLAAALGRNIFEDEAAPGAALLAAYIRQAAASIDAQPVLRIVGGIVHFPEPEGAAE
jgi:cytochrome b pre-mRNA-processing protein 3